MQAHVSADLSRQESYSHSKPHSYNSRIYPHCCFFDMSRIMEKKRTQALPRKEGELGQVQGARGAPRARRQRQPHHMHHARIRGGPPVGGGVGWKPYSSGYASGARGLWKREPVLWREVHSVHFLGTWTLLGSLGMDPLSQPWGQQSDLAWWAGPPCGLQLSPHPTTERLTPTTGIFMSSIYFSRPGINSANTSAGAVPSIHRASGHLLRLISLILPFWLHSKATFFMKPFWVFPVKSTAPSWALPPQFASLT